MNTDSYSKSGSHILVVCPNPSVDNFAWVDRILPGKTNRIKRQEHYPGGKGVHVALALAELGEVVKLLGLWGGPTGSWIASTCERMYPKLRCLGPMMEGFSRSCYTFKSDGELNETEILGVGPEFKENDLNALIEAFDEMVVQAKCVVLSGSWPPGADGDEYQRLIDVASHYKKASFVDCTGDQLINALKARPHAVHLNRSEYEDLLGAGDFSGSLGLLLDQCDQVALTDGAKGLYLIEKNQTVHAISPIDPVQSAVGSGDCLVAGLARAYTMGLDLLESARLAASCGAANCLRRELGMLSNNDVNRLSKNARVKVFRGHLNFN
jgi:1-phosphofructokinase family hexose kinase